VPKASLTKTVAPESSTRRARTVVPLLGVEPTFSRRRTPESARAARAFTSGPMQSDANVTGRPISSDKRAPTGARLASGVGPFFGRLRCEASTTRSASSGYSSVGSEARMRVSSVILPPSTGTL
jgi:hypothetical protein